MSEHVHTAVEAPGFTVGNMINAFKSLVDSGAVDLDTHVVVMGGEHGTLPHTLKFLEAERYDREESVGGSVLWIHVEES